MLNNENLDNKDLIEEKHNKKGYTHIITFLSCLISLSLLIGIWYVNNQKLFLTVENNQLKMEVKNLKEQNATLRAIDNQDKNVDSNLQQKNNGYKEYEVKPGDTLGGISYALFGSENYANEIAKINGLDPESILQLGQKLKIPNKSKI